MNLFDKIKVSDNIFATAINCIDGRVQTPVIEWIKNRHSVDYVDIITDPGPIKILTENIDTTTIQSIKKRVEISITVHNSKLVALVGHHDCAGNPVNKDTQLKQIASAIETVKSWDFEIQIIGLWIDENWKAYEIE